MFVGVEKGIIPSLGYSVARVSLGEHYLYLKTNRVQQDIPLMFELDQHKLHRCSSDRYNNSFANHPSGTKMPVTYKQVHLWSEWPVTEVLFTKSQSKKLHDRFGHPCAKVRMNILKRARSQDFNEEKQRKIQELTQRCLTCQTYTTKPVTYHVSIAQDEIDLNHEIEVDLFWIEGKAALNIIDRGT